tara:strand:+ start:479 stop:1288 length:810 start_codon:yes stop_codon:yes gene_type:complete
MPATWAAVGAVGSVLGGIFGSSQSSKANKLAEKRYQEQKKINEEQAKITNEYNQATFEAEKNDYYAAREFQYDMALKQFKYQTDVQDFRYLQDVRQYGKSVENYGQQLVYNNMAYQSAKDSQMAAYNETLDAAAFDKQSMLVEKLHAEGQASMVQAGASRGKAIQAANAQHGRDLAVLRATLVSSTEELQRGLMDNALQKYGADMQAKANLMIKPERLPALIKPELGPERTFIEPAEVLPGAVPPVQRQSTFAPILSGITNAASILSKV